MAFLISAIKVVTCLWQRSFQLLKLWHVYGWPQYSCWFLGMSDETMKISVHQLKLWHVCWNLDMSTAFYISSMKVVKCQSLKLWHVHGWPQFSRGHTNYEESNADLSLPIDIVTCLLKFGHVYSILHIIHLTLVLLNLDISCLYKQCISRSVGFFRSQLIWICTVFH